MDSLINGEVSEEPVDKKDASDLSTEESCKPILYDKKNDLTNTNSSDNIHSVEKDTSDNSLHNTSNSDENIPQKNGSTGNATVNENTDAVNTVNSSANSNLSNASSQVENSEADNLSKNKPECSETSSTDVQGNDASSPADKESEIVNCAKQTDKESMEISANHSENEDAEDLSVASSKTKPDVCSEPIKSANISDPKMEVDGTNHVDPCPSITSDRHSSQDTGKTSIDLAVGSKWIADSCKNLTEKVQNNATDLSSKSPTITNKDNSNVSCPDPLPLNFNSISENGAKNESNPLDQLNQHLKTLGYNDSVVTNFGLSKPDAQDSSTSKTESAKSCPHDADRLKQSDSFVFTELSNEETGFPDVFNGLVVIGKYISVKGDFTLRSTEALVESPSLIAPYLLKEPDSFPPRMDDSKYEQKDFFHSTAGEMLIGIGLGRVSEWYHRDMTRIKKRQMKKSGKSPELEQDLKMHEAFYNEGRKANKVYSFPLKVCEKCGFVTESSIVMEGHLLVPHINMKREYQCNFCDTVNRDPKAILEHMYRIHQKTGRIQPPVLFFECPFCTYESNSKVKLGNHFAKCQRFYDPNHNQAPPKDFEFPALTPKPITVAVVKSYEKSMSSMQRGRGRPKKIDSLAEQLSMNQYPSSMNHASLLPSHVPPYRPSSTTALSENLSSITNQMISSMHGMPNMSLRPPPHSNLGPLRTALPPPMHLPSANRYFQVVNSSASSLMPMLGSSPLVTSPSQFPYSPNLVGANSASKKSSTPSPQFLNSLFGGSLRQQNVPKSVPEVTITPLPKLHGPYPVPVAKPSNKPSSNSSSSSNSLVVCEICDGYIKDLEQLRSHMQLIHKVKIHPKMLVSRPPLNCQKCQWRFFTDQGLERHLLGAHGLVTSNMQELANKSKDAGCCTICGRVFASKLVSHMNQVHKLTLKPAHLSYKCTVCSATFNLYRLFENHVYLVHSGAAKRPADGGSNASKKLKPSGDYVDSRMESDSSMSYSEKKSSKCTDCGSEFRKHAAQTEKCEKCLKCDAGQGTLNSKLS